MMVRSPELVVDAADRLVDTSLNAAHELGASVVQGMVEILAPFPPEPLDAHRNRAFGNWVTSLDAVVEPVAEPEYQGFTVTEEDLLRAQNAIFN